MKIRYKELRLNRSSLEIVAHANQILEAYAEQGLNLTLRQLYYQFVARGLLRENSLKEYKRIGAIINDARLAGLIDWDMLSDRTRSLAARSHWQNPQSIIEGAAESYHRDLWDGQDYRVEVWIEKDALTGIIALPCYRYDVAYFACKGYTSQSEMWGAAMRLKRYNRAGIKVVILHLGDHDPSGQDMTRDIAERLEMFGASADVKRIALTMDQIRRYNPPPNWAKITDTRAKDYIEKFGEYSWELDALEPATLTALIETNIEKHLEKRMFNRVKANIEEERKVLRSASKHWPEVAAFLKSKWKGGE